MEKTHTLTEESQTVQTLLMEENAIENCIILYNMTKNIDGGCNPLVNKEIYKYISI